MYSSCIITFACINQTYAQNAKVRFGIKAGVDLMTQGSFVDNYSGRSEGYQYRAGFQAGLCSVVTISNKIDFIPQILYTQKGATALKPFLVESDAIGQVMYENRINYLDVPLLIGFKSQPGFTLFIGPQVAFLLSQKTSLYNTTTTGTDGLKSEVISGNLGLGFAAGPDVSINLIYNRDFQRTAKGDVNGTERDSGLAFTVSYLF
jgi:hypothetical protein